MERQEHLQRYKEYIELGLIALERTEKQIRSAKTKRSCGTIHTNVDEAGDYLIFAEAHYQSAHAVGGRLLDAKLRYESAHKWFVKSCVRR